MFNLYGIALASLGDFEGSIPKFEKAHELNPSEVSNLENLGNSQSEAGAFDGARLTYSKIIELDDSNASAYASRAFSNYNLKAYQKGLLDIDKALSLNDGNPQFYDYRALLKEGLGNYRSAIEDYTTSIDIELDSYILYKRGLLKIKLKKKKKACQDFKQSKEMKNQDGSIAFEKYCAK